MVRAEDSRRVNSDPPLQTGGDASAADPSLVREPGGVGSEAGAGGLDVLGSDEASNPETPSDTQDSKVPEVEYSPRRPPPEIPEWNGPNLTCPAALPPRDVHLLGPDPWVPGGCGILSAAKKDLKRGLHFDSLWKSENLKLSPDRTSATCRGQDFGGFLVSSEVLDRKPFGRWFELLVEEVDVSRWSDGLGVGIAVISSRDEALTNIKNVERIIQGFACELIPQCWLVGYDGRAKLRGLSRYLQVTELTRGMWRPNELKSGDIVGLLVTADGNLMLFVNEELRYFVRCGDIPWKAKVCAVVDLDGCTKSVHLLDSNGTPPAKVMQAWHSAVKAPALS